MTTETIDHLPAGWFVLDVMKCRPRGREWVALAIDVDPTNEDWFRKAREAWVRVPGRHRDRDAAWAALEEASATRH